MPLEPAIQSQCVEVHARTAHDGVKRGRDKRKRRASLGKEGSWTEDADNIGGATGQERDHLLHERWLFHMSAHTSPRVP